MKVTISLSWLAPLIGMQRVYWAWNAKCQTPAIGPGLGLCMVCICMKCVVCICMKCVQPTLLSNSVLDILFSHLATSLLHCSCSGSPPPLSETQSLLHAHSADCLACNLADLRTAAALSLIAFISSSLLKPRLYSSAMGLCVARRWNFRANLA